MAKRTIWESIRGFLTGQTNGNTAAAAKGKLAFALAAAMLAFLMLVIQLFSVSVLKGKEWTEKAMRQWSRTTYIKADRGQIHNTPPST